MINLGVKVQVFMMSSQEFSIALEKRKVPKPKLTPSVMDKVKLILSKRLEQYKTTLEVSSELAT